MNTTVHVNVGRELSFLLKTPEQDQQADHHDRFSSVSCSLLSEAVIMELVLAI